MAEHLHHSKGHRRDDFLQWQSDAQAGRGSAVGDSAAPSEGPSLAASAPHHEAVEARLLPALQDGAALVRAMVGPEPAGGERLSGPTCGVLHQLSATRGCGAAWGHRMGRPREECMPSVFAAATTAA